MKRFGSLASLIIIFIILVVVFGEVLAYLALDEWLETIPAWNSFVSMLPGLLRDIAIEVFAALIATAIIGARFSKLIGMLVRVPK